jgi:cytochrome c oxidase assembly protein subunit 11
VAPCLTVSRIQLVPGETALAFFTVKNTTDKAITGVATYNVFPAKAGETPAHLIHCQEQHLTQLCVGLYFNKIQCFCFEEQRLGPGEEIDMPVFFFIDPEIVDDPAMRNVNSIVLSYTFFKTDEDDDVAATSAKKAVIAAGDNGSSKNKPVSASAAV